MCSGLPLVSVLMPVRNGERYLRQAVDSVLSQKFHDFEFIIIDDASTDNTPQILRSYSDSRIRVLPNELRLGVARSLNRGLGAARGKYIARQDADDTSEPERFERQVRMMEANPSIVVLGTSATVIDGEGKVESFWDCATEDVELKWSLIKGSPFIHPSIFIRSEAIRRVEGYPISEEVSFCEDFELWSRLERQGEFRCLPERLMRLRIARGSISAENDQIQRRQADEILLRNRGRLLTFELSGRDAQQLDALFFARVGTNPALSGIKRSISIYEALMAGFHMSYAVDHPNEAGRHTRRKALAAARHCLALTINGSCRPADRVRLLVGAARLSRLAMSSPGRLRRAHAA